MERAHVAAWPARETAVVSGWLWRCSGGGSQRANSVSTVDFSGSGIEAAVQDIEARYRTRGAPARFQIFDETQPAILPEVLQRRGYRQAESTITMFKPAEPANVAEAVERRDAPWPGWLDVYLGAITESRRQANQQILAAIPAPRAFFGYRRNGRIIATALCVISHGCAVIECVATDAAKRRSGAARATLQTLLTWAASQGTTLTGLQVTEANAPAINLYQSLGFTPGARNHFWVRDTA